MFPEIEGGTQMQPKKIGGTWGKRFENPCSMGPVHARLELPERRKRFVV